MQFKVYTDEQITVWQRVGLVITAESERELEEILNEPPPFQKAMAAGQIEYTGDTDIYWETEEHKEWEHDSVEFTIIKENEHA